MVRRVGKERHHGTDEQARSRTKADSVGAKLCSCQIGQSGDQTEPAIGQIGRSRTRIEDQRGNASGNLKALFKKLGFSFRRIRTYLKSRQVGVDREEKEAALKVLAQLSESEQIDLYFGDEASFSMQPCVPRAWQAKGKQIRI